MCRVTVFLSGSETIHLDPLQGEPALSGQVGLALFFFRHHINIVKRVSISLVGFYGHAVVTCVVYIQNIKVHIGTLTPNYYMIMCLRTLSKPYGVIFN